MFEKDGITAKQAAQILGRSPSAISRALASGRLEYCDPERKLLSRPGLEQRFANRTRPKADVRQVAQRDTGIEERIALLPEPPSPPAIATDYWGRLAQKLALVLDGGEAYWQREEPDAHHLKLFCHCVDELRIQVEMEGLEP